MTPPRCGISVWPQPQPGLDNLQFKLQLQLRNFYQESMDQDGTWHLIFRAEMQEQVSMAYMYVMEDT
jgi:hypothetical protein